MVRRAHANGDIYVGSYEGWYCPAEGFKAASDVVKDAEGTRCPNHPTVELQWLSEQNWFFRLSAYQQRLEHHFEEHPDFAQPDYRRNEMLGFIRGGLEDSSISRSGAEWGIPFPIMPDGSSSQLADGSWDPAAGTIYVWYDALINYVTGAGFPDDPAAFEKWWPAELHVIGKDIARFHTIYWPAMLWSAGLEAPRHVWIHGFLLAQGERMSKSLGNFLDPLDVVRTFGADGARYVALREVPFDRDADVSWDSFVRRYNSDLANNFGNLLNRTVSMVNRYLDGARPGPSHGSLRARWTDVLPAYQTKLEACQLSDALAELWDFVDAANREVDLQQPWALAKEAKAGVEGKAEHLSFVLGDLVEACRLIGLAVAPFMPTAAPKILAQLGYDYPYASDGNAGADILPLLEWGAGFAAGGRVAAPQPLFPRLETEAAPPAAG
jgi:methionyl-tRNA synthetase